MDEIYARREFEMINLLKSNCSHLMDSLLFHTYCKLLMKNKFVFCYILPNFKSTKLSYNYLIQIQKKTEVFRTGFTSIFLVISLKFEMAADVSFETNF